MYAEWEESGKERFFVADIESEELEFWVRQKSMLGDSMQRRLLRRKMVKFSSSQSWMKQSNCLEEIMGSGNPPCCGNHPVISEELSGDLRGSSDKSQPIDEMMADREAHIDFRSIEGNYIYRHHVEPRVQLHVPKEETFPIPPRYIDNTYDLGCVARKPCR